MSDFSLESKAFSNNSEIPKKYGYKNGNVSPPLTINNPPNGTQSLALIMDDPDAMAPAGKVWVHWVMWNIDPSTSEITEGNVPSEASEGNTDFGENGYGGPAPPDKRHTYVFKLYALDTKLDLNTNSTKKDVEKSMENHILDEATLKGTYAP